MVSLTGFAPVISCMRGRRVGWTTPQGQKWWEVLADGHQRAARFTSRVSDECSTDELRSRNGVPSRNFTSNLTLRTRPL